MDCGPWGKGGHVIRDSRGDGVVVWLKNRMIYRKVFSIVDRERFYMPGHKGWKSRGEGAEHVQRSRESDALDSALKEGVGLREGVVRRGWKRGNQ